MYDPAGARKARKSEQRSFLIFIGVLLFVYVIFIYPETNDFSYSRQECAELNELLATQFKDDFQFSDEWSTGSFECPSEEAGMARALSFISNLDIGFEDEQGDLSFYLWAKELKPTFGNDILFRFLGLAAFESRKVTLDTDLLQKGNWVKIAGVMVHELRHIDQTVDTHVVCNKHSRLRCDARLENDPTTGGGYNFNILFWDAVRKSSKTSRYEKKLAKREMQAIFDDFFNTVPNGASAKYDLN